MKAAGSHVQRIGAFSVVECRVREPSSSIDRGEFARAPAMGGFHSARCVTLMALAVTLIVPGCSKKDEGPKVLPLEGRIEKIDARSNGTGELTVLYYSEKHKQEILGTAVVTKDTEIMIDGTVSSLKDIREGERVRGEVRIDKKGDERIHTVLKLTIERPRAATSAGD